jgi:hypothetical protein
VSAPPSGWRAAAAHGATAALVAVQAGAAAAIARALRPDGAPGRWIAPSPGAGGLASVRRAVVLRPDEIGDVVVTGPFLREFRRLLPDAHITLVVKPAARALVEHCPYVDAVHVYPGRRHARALRPIVLPVVALRFALAALRPQRPDLVVLPRWDGDQSYATFAAAWSGAPWVVGYSERVSPYRQTINRGFDRLLTQPLGAPEHGGAPPAVRHEVERALDVVRALGGTVDRRRSSSGSIRATAPPPARRSPRCGLRGPPARSWPSGSAPATPSVAGPPSATPAVARTLKSRRAPRSW